jgi:hypothetical protein
LTAALKGDLENLVVRDLDLIEDPVAPGGTPDEALAGVNWPDEQPGERQGLA